MKTFIILALLITLPGLQSCQHPQHRQEATVVSMTKVIDTNAPDHEICSALALTKENVETYFSIADEVDEFVFHDEAIILPCKYQGSIRIQGQELQWEIYAGGAGYLYNKMDVNKRFLCRKHCCGALPNLC
jgi:hypothetical protein